MKLTSLIKFNKLSLIILSIVITLIGVIVFIQTTKRQNNNQSQNTQQKFESILAKFTASEENAVLPHKQFLLLALSDFKNKIFIKKINLETGDLENSNTFNLSKNDNIPSQSILTSAGSHNPIQFSEDYSKIFFMRGNWPAEGTIPPYFYSFWETKTNDANSTKELYKTEYHIGPAWMLLSDNEILYIEDYDQKMREEEPHKTALTILNTDTKEKRILHSDFRNVYQEWRGILRLSADKKNLFYVYDKLNEIFLAIINVENGDFKKEKIIDFPPAGMNAVYDVTGFSPNLKYFAYFMPAEYEKIAPYRLKGQFITKNNLTGEQIFAKSLIIGIYSLLWSPNSRYVLFYGQTEENKFGWMIYDIDGNKIINIDEKLKGENIHPDMPVNLQPMAWPNNDNIIFMRNTPTGFGEIISYNFENKDIISLFKFPEQNSNYLQFSGFAFQ